MTLHGVLCRVRRPSAAGSRHSRQRLLAERATILLLLTILARHDRAFYVLIAAVHNQQTQLWRGFHIRHAFSDGRATSLGGATVKGCPSATKRALGEKTSELGEQNLGDSDDTQISVHVDRGKYFQQVVIREYLVPGTCSPVNRARTRPSNPNRLVERETRLPIVCSKGDDA